MTFKKSSSRLTEDKLISKGFTLIELLVVIAILGVLAVGLIAAINPADKINSAGDSRVLSDIGVMARATESFSAGNNGFYPAGTANLTASGDLKAVPAAPSGYSAYVFTALPSACTSGTTCTSVTITGQLKSIKYTATPVAKFESATGKQCQVATTGTACP